MHVQVHVVHKKDFKVYKCTCFVSCASVVCLISLAGCACNFTIKAHAVFLLFLVLLHCLSLSSLFILGITYEHLEAGVCVFWGIYRVL